MLAWTKELTQSINLTMNVDEQVGYGGEGAWGGRPLANGFCSRAHHLLQPVDGRLSRGGYRHGSGIADESSSSCCKQANEKNGQTSRSVGTCLSRRTQKTRHATSSWAAAWRAVTADISDRDRGPGGAGFGETWQNTRRSTARSSRLVVKNRSDVPADLRHIP